VVLLQWQFQFIRELKQRVKLAAVPLPDANKPKP